MTRLRSLARRAAFHLWSLAARRDFTRPSGCRVLELDLVVLPGVLHPRHFASSRFLAAYADALDLRGLAALDLGTGSGLLAMVLARRGAEVMAADVDPVAVSCATENVRRNGFANRVSVVESDVFQRLPEHRRFDLVLSNPPFFPRDPTHPADRAFAAGATNRFFADLAATLAGRLNAHGRLIMVFSSDADVGPVLDALAAHGFVGRPLRSHRSFFETLTIFEFTGFVESAQVADSEAQRT